MNGFFVFVSKANIYKNLDKIQLPIPSRLNIKTRTYLTLYALPIGKHVIYRIHTTTIFFAKKCISLQKIVFNKEEGKYCENNSTFPVFTNAFCELQTISWTLLKLIINILLEKSFDDYFCLHMIPYLFIRGNNRFLYVGDK